MNDHSDRPDRTERVGIAELKRRLSRYVKAAREGRTVTVLDRNTPVARLVPYHSTTPLSVREPRPDAPRLGAIRMPDPLPDASDIVALLAEERGER